MASTLGTFGERIISEAPIPAAAVPQLRREFGGQLAANRNLDATARVEWFTEVKDVPAVSAERLCDHNFTIDQINTILDHEKRRGPVITLLNRNDDDLKAVTAIVEHRNGLAAAEALVGNDAFPQQRLLPFIAKMKPAKRAALLASLPPDELSDDDVAEHLAGIENGLTDARRGAIAARCNELINLRPGLGGKLLAAGAPPITFTSLAGSPWINEDEVQQLLKLLTTATATTRKYVEGALAGNPWVDPIGAISTGLTFGDSRETRHRRLRKDVAHIVGSPTELAGDELMTAVWRSLPSRYKAWGRPPLLVLVAQNPHLEGPWVTRVGSQLSDVANSNYPPPLWALAAAEAAFSANFPGSAELVKGAGDPPERISMQRTPREPAPVDPARVEELFTRMPVPQLDLNASMGRAVMARFAEALGDDPAAWIAAALLVDGSPVTFSELADLAAVAS